MIPFPTILLRLALALVLGALVGLERESSAHAAGLRTNALVALGSCLFMIVSIYGFLDLLGIPHVQIDPSRVASYVVAGIGFLGGGAIFLSRDQDKVKGLTTAAAIWMVAAIGLACGAGLLLIAGTATALALIVLVLLRYAEPFFLLRHAPGIQHLHVETTSAAGPLIGQVYDTCVRTGVRVEKLEVRTGKEGEILMLACLVPNVATLTRTIGELHTLPGIRAVNADLHSIRIRDAL